MSDATLIEAFEYAGMTCELHADWDAAPPSEWDQLGTIYALESGAQYRGFKPPSETHGLAIEAADRRGGAGLVRYLHAAHGIYAVAVRVDDYGSSGTRLSWDVDDPNAYIATTDARVAELAGEGYSPEWIADALRGELGEWQSYFSGDVVGYVVRDASGAVVDSCWGFYPGSPGEPGPQSTPAYRAAWDALAPYQREHAEALAEAFAAAEHEARERERAEREGIATR